MQSKTTRSIIAIGATSLLALSTIAPAQAQNDSETSSPGGSVDNALRDLVVSSSENPDFAGSSLRSALNSLSFLGSSEIPLGGPLLSSDDRYPLELNESITAPQIREKVIERPHERVERWFVDSPSMGRVVEVQIKKAADPTAAAPMIYMLDGIGGSTPDSGWINHGAAQRVFGEENVTLVMPTHAAGSVYSDWAEDDPNLGRHQWETFIVEELAPLLDAEEELNFNGKRGIGGLSMGAIGGVHIANTNPDIFDATFGISGCYSPNDNIGRQTVNLVVSSCGGNVENMWGPFGSEQWQRHDTVANPEGLRHMAVYLSAANGIISEEDRASFDDEPFFNMAAGAILERGVLRCTEQLDQALTERGMEHRVFDYTDEGVHNWRNYNAQLQPAWDAIKSALQS